ncbi:MAG: flagellar protein FlgN [Candidatus Tectomicrobia bacterium]|uniref:Flagellar protein FlgN n=1 Tax=Tectimicrobiota bacterium TaxID=2528274 RepID=A0A932CLF1_UNCTE|nr:flagellar protein FlgN [Candidatus Tectomicrobia bacterium]
MWNELIDLLRENLGLYADLRAELEADRQRVIDLDVEGILVSNRRKEAITLKLKALEEKRGALVGAYAQEMGLSARGLTLSRLGSAAPEPLRAELRELSSRLRAQLREVRHVGQDNLQLIQRSQGFLQRWLALLGHGRDQQKVYRPNGRLQEGQRAGQLLSGQV